MNPGLELKVAREAAAAAASIARHGFRNLTEIKTENKSDESGYQGIVTQVDVDAEAAIISRIRQTFPDHQFMAEEGFAEQISAENLWIIDPLDGTNNFAHGIPHYAISVAYYRNGVPQCGCVLNPETEDEFLTEAGAGAWHNDKRVSVNQHTELAETMLAVGFYYDRGAMMRATLAAMEACFENGIHGIRRMGTAALDIVQVGLGRFGGFFEYQLSPWDFAAARLFLTEAEGTITTCQGDDLPLEKTSVLATNGKLHDPLLEIVQKHAGYASNT